MQHGPRNRNQNWSYNYQKFKKFNILEISIGMSTRLQNNLLTRFPIPNVILSTSSLVKYSRMETIILSTVERISLEASWQTSNKRKPGKRGRKFFKNFLSPPFVCPRTVALQFYRANSVARSFSISRAVYLSYFPLLPVLTKVRNSTG